MSATLNTRSLSTLDDVPAFLDGTVPVGFVVPAGDGERRQWVADTFAQCLGPDGTGRRSSTPFRPDRALQRWQRVFQSIT